MTFGPYPGDGALGSSAPLVLIAALVLSVAWLATGVGVVAQPALVLGAGEDDATSALTLDDLEAMPQTTIVTEHDFIDGAVAYRGPLMRDVIAGTPLAGAPMLRFIAANDYIIDIPASDFRNYAVILAMEADGVKLSRRERGPLWLMYPISDHPELRDRTYIERLIWQVVRIEPLGP